MQGTQRRGTLVVINVFVYCTLRITNLALTLLAARCSWMLHLLNLFCIIQRMSTGGAAAAYTSTAYPSSGSSTEFPRVTPNHAPRIPTKWCEMPWHSGKTKSDSMQVSCILMSFFPQVWLTTISAATRTTPTTSTKLQQSGALRPIPALSGKPAHLWVWLLQLLSPAFGAEGFQIQIPLVDWQPCKNNNWSSSFYNRPNTRTEECTDGYAITNNEVRTLLEICAYVLWVFAAIYCILVCCLLDRTF